MNENGASGFGGVLQIKIKPILTEQPCVSQCACTSVSKHIHVFGYVHSCVVTCLSPPHLLQPHAPPPYPQGYCPTPDPALPGPSGPVAKKKKRYEGEPFSAPMGGSQCGSVSQAQGPLLWAVVPSRPPPAPKRTEGFEMSPQTPDSRDAPLYGSCWGALMTDSIFVFVNMPRKRS